MVLISWIVSLLCVATALSANAKNETESKKNNNIWVLLFAGSHKWMRYRHQANICHAYKLLRDNGIPRTHIITFMYDDIAYNPENPEPGVIRSKPDGPNLYHGVPIDYSGDELRKDVYLNVLQGKFYKLKGIGSERVVLSYFKDNILIYHTGLGGEGGFVEFPGSGDDYNMFGHELIDVFKRLHKFKRYNNILMYLESSHSGAFFDNATLPHNLNVMALTAGGPDEDTVGTWCNTFIQPCLAGLFSYTWLTSAEKAPAGLSVFNHYDEVRNLVAETGKEHPQIYGDWKVGHLPISDFIGYSKNKTIPHNHTIYSNNPVKYQNNVFKSSLLDKDMVISNDISYQLAGNESNIQIYS